MAGAGERDVELGPKAAIVVVEWLRSYRPAPSGLGAMLSKPRALWLVDKDVPALIDKLIRYASRANASPTIRLTEREAEWFAARSSFPGMFGRSFSQSLSPTIGGFCLRCQVALRKKRGAPRKSARDMIRDTKVDRNNGEDGQRTVRRLRRRIEEARRHAEWAEGFEGLGANLIRATAEKFD